MLLANNIKRLGSIEEEAALKLPYKARAKAAKLTTILRPTTKLTKVTAEARLQDNAKKTLEVAP